MNALAVGTTSNLGIGRSSVSRDPAMVPYPPMLPVELALRQHSVKTICEAYGIDSTEWSALKQNPVFLDDLKARVAELKRDGMTFRMKARLQAEEMLKKSWEMVHSPGDAVPPAVRADLIKFTIRAAGYDGSKDQAAAAIAAGTNLQINLVLK